MNSYLHLSSRVLLPSRSQLCASPFEMRPNFAQCGTDFQNNPAGIYNRFLYNGSVQGLLSAARPAFITVQGCKELCGTGVDYYSWLDASNTITTWILPIAGLLVQAPYESNKAWQTILALCRWSGSPIAALSYILWNIKVTGKCALMVDMATKYEEYPEQGSEFSMMRDALYILCIMNQYSAKQSLPPVEAERLLRLALFSNLLPLNGSSDAHDLVKRRTELAQNFREGREYAFLSGRCLFSTSSAPSIQFWGIIERSFHSRAGPEGGADSEAI